MAGGSKQEIMPKRERHARLATIRLLSVVLKHGGKDGIHARPVDMIPEPRPFTNARPTVCAGGDWVQAFAP